MNFFILRIRNLNKQTDVIKGVVKGQCKTSQFFAHMIYFDFRVFKWECKMLGFTIFRYHVIYKTKQQIRTSKLSWPCKMIHVL